MSQEKYIGMDVHQATISVAVTDSRGKLCRPVALRAAWLIHQPARSPFTDPMHLECMIGCTTPSLRA
jgi:hypothetical protein